MTFNFSTWTPLTFILSEPVTTPLPAGEDTPGCTPEGGPGTPPPGTPPAPFRSTRVGGGWILLTDSVEGVLK